MGLPIRISDSEYVKAMYAKVSRGVGIYRHIPPERLLNARWIYFKNLMWISDFGGLAYNEKIVFPHISNWLTTKVLIYNKHDNTNNINLNLYIPSVVYKLYNGFPDNQILKKSDIIFDFYSGLFWDCRVENLSLSRDENYGLGYNDI